jgi:hypothetical protein
MRGDRVSPSSLYAAMRWTNAIRGLVSTPSTMLPRRPLTHWIMLASRWRVRARPAPLRTSQQRCQLLSQLLAQDDPEANRGDGNRGEDQRPFRLVSFRAQEPLLAP